MKIELIDVQTSNIKYKTDIRMLVDKLEFLNKINVLREKWKFNKLTKLKKLSEITSLLDLTNPLLYSELSQEEIESELPKFNIDIESMLKDFNRGKNFRLVVLYSLITGTVPEGAYRSCYFDIVTINEPEDLNKPENYQYVIVMSPRTEKTEVDEAFEEFKQHIKEKIKFHSPRIPLDSEATDEFTNAVECLEKEKKIYENEIAGTKSVKEINLAINKYLKNTQGAREYLLSIGELDIDVPEHKELIETYHTGNTYPTADKDKYETKITIDFMSECYWIAYGKYFNGELKEPLSPGQVYKEWQNKCPVNRDKKLIEKEYCICKYCIVDPSTVMKAPKKYLELLAIS